MLQALSIVNHKGLHQGWGRLSYIYIYIFERTNKAPKDWKNRVRNNRSTIRQLWQVSPWWTIDLDATDINAAVFQVDAVGQQLPGILHPNLLQVFLKCLQKRNPIKNVISETNLSSRLNTWKVRQKKKIVSLIGHYKHYTVELKENVPFNLLCVHSPVSY